MIAFGRAHDAVDLRVETPLEAFKAGVRRRLGRQALCVHLAGERRELAKVRIIHLLAESKTVLYDVEVTPPMLDAKVTDWRKARFGGGDEERDALHDQVADAFDVREQHIDELTAFRVGAPK